MYIMYYTKFEFHFILCVTVIIYWPLYLSQRFWLTRRWTVTWSQVSWRHHRWTETRCTWPGTRGLWWCGETRGQRVSQAWGKERRICRVKLHNCRVDAGFFRSKVEGDTKSLRRDSVTSWRYIMTSHHDDTSWHYIVRMYTSTWSPKSL